MSRSSCLAIPANNKFVVIRQHHMATFGQNEDVCKIVNMLAFKATSAITNAIGESLPYDEDLSPWFSLSLKEMQEYLLGTVCKTNTCLSLTYLEKIGVIERTIGGGATKTRYRLNAGLLNAWSSSKHVAPTYESVMSDPVQKQTGSFFDTCPEMDSPPVQKWTAPLSKNGQPDGVYIGRGFNTRIEEEDKAFPESPLSPQDQNLPLPEESQEPESTPLPYSGGPLPGDDITKEANLRKEMDCLSFVRRSYSDTRGAKVTSSDITKNAERLESLEAEYGQVEFRRSLLNFLASDNDKVRSSKWALSMFLRDPLRNMTQSPRSPRQSGGYSASPIAYRSAGTSEASAGAPTASLQNTSDPVLQFVDKWNTINPDHPVGELLAATKAKLRAATSDPDFVRVHEELFEKVGKFMAAGQDIGFPWMFAGKEPNWVRTMEGVFNFFLVKKGPAGGGVDMDRLIQEAED